MSAEDKTHIIIELDDGTTCYWMFDKEDARIDSTFTILGSPDSMKV